MNDARITEIIDVLLHALEILGVVGAAVVFVWKVGQWFGALQSTVREGFRHNEESHERIIQTVYEGDDRLTNALVEHTKEAAKRDETLKNHETRIVRIETKMTDESQD